RSISVLLRSSTRSTPFPSADPRLPRMRLARASVVIECSFVRAFRGRSRYAVHPGAAPKGSGTGLATRRARRAARGEGCRSAAGPPGGRRQALPLAAPASDATPRGEQSAAVPPAHRRWLGRGPVLRAWSACFRPPRLEEQLPST